MVLALYSFLSHFTGKALSIVLCFFLYMKLLGKGKHGIVYVGQKNGKEVAVKVPLPGSGAFRVLQSEAYWLKKVNDHQIGPRFLSLDEHGLVMELIAGDTFQDWYPVHKGTVDCKKVFSSVLWQCRTLDIIGVQKEEMHHPVKHILIVQRPKTMRAVLIDFERSRASLRPSNVTQFCQFLVSLGEPHCADWKQIVQEYKHHQTDGAFQNVKKCFSL